MRRKYLPRVARGVLAGGGVLAAAFTASLGGCHEATAPAVAVDRLAPVITLGTLPPGDTLPQRGIDLPITLTGQGTVRDVEVITDPGTAAERVTSLVGGYSYFQGIPLSGGASFTVWLPHSLPDGRHTINIRATSDSGHAQTVGFSRVIATPGAAYTATVLPGIGPDTAYAYGINSRGDVAGYVASAGRRPRPVVWYNAQPTALPDTSAAGARAIRIDDAGDVLGDVLGDVPGALYSTTGSLARVWRADGRLLTVGPVAISGAYAPAGTTCCTAAADLSDTRVALAYGPYGVVLLDLVSGATQVLTPYPLPLLTPTSLNDRGQAVGTQLRFGSLDGNDWWMSGPALTIQTASYGRCSHPHAIFRTLDAVGNAGEVLASSACVTVLSIPGEPPLTVDQTLAPGTLKVARMNRQATVLVGLDGADSTLYAWRRSDRRAVRIRLTTGAWKIDALESVNAGGMIVAHGLDVPSGRSAALLLTPAAAPR